MGKSSVYGNNRILFWQDPNPHPVYSVSISSGLDADGTWQFSDIRGQNVFKQKNAAMILFLILLPEFKDNNRLLT